MEDQRYTPGEPLMIEHYIDAVLSEELSPHIRRIICDRTRRVKLVKLADIIYDLLPYSEDKVS